MVFTVLLWVAIAVILVVFISQWMYDSYFLDGLLAAFIAALVSALVIFIYSAIVTHPTFWHVTSSAKAEYEIRALTTDSDVTGKRYLFSGYIDEKPVISYIRDNGDGGLLLKRVDASDSVIYEGDYEPEIEITTTEYGNPFFHPWTREYETFSFRVPEGSVSTEVAVAP